MAIDGLLLWAQSIIPEWIHKKLADWNLLAHRWSLSKNVSTCLYITISSIIESFQGFHGCALRKLMSEFEHPKSFRMLYNDSLVVWPSGQRLQQHTTYTFTPSHAEFHILDHGARVNCEVFWCELLSQSLCWDNPMNKLGFPWNWSDSKQFLRSDWIHFDVYSVVSKKNVVTVLFLHISATSCPHWFWLLNRSAGLLHFYPWQWHRHDCFECSVVGIVWLMQQSLEME